MKNEKLTIQHQTFAVASNSVSLVYKEVMRILVYVCPDDLKNRIIKIISDIPYHVVGNDNKFICIFKRYEINYNIA